MGAATRTASISPTVVGVAAGDAAAVRRSLDLLAAHTDPSVRLVELERTGAYAFNQLISHDAELLVLVEAGALVGPRWLDLLATALARTGAGLAGPSTNRAWNEQGSIRSTPGLVRGPDSLRVRQEALLALRRFGSAVSTLAPLYSLGSFCYAVRRAVVDAIGPADPAYEDGPCWEMDYNIRAARAGFDGVWVQGAYVLRTAATDAEPLLARNRELYQDRFCGRRLRAATELDPVVEYEPHCRGADCAEFAPRDLITLRIGPPPDVPPPSISEPATSPPAVTTRPVAPLVSCVMPTRDRPGFAAQAAAYFLAQDYPNAELIVVDDGLTAVRSRLPADPRIRVIRPEPDPPTRPRSIGDLRNAGCAAARGEFVVLWDDDDWHGPSRLTDQVAPLLAGTADVTGLTDLVWYEPASGQAWRLAPDLHRRMLRLGVYGGTIAFRRSLWPRFGFPDRSLAEDADFLEQVVRGGAHLVRLSGQGRYVYIRHERNSWRLTPGRAVQRSGWTPVPVPELPVAAAAFYAALTRPEPQTEAFPLVSCIMPTRNRRPYIGRAIDYFLRQDHPAKELVILDDGDDPVEDLVPATTGISYHRLEQRTVLGAKRNLACELARGEVIAHWDDDDWQAPGRLSLQAARLAGGGADVCGAGSLLFWDPVGGRAWRYTWPIGRRGWAAGTSLCYPRSLWQRAPFAEVPIGEDTRFVWQSAVRRLADVREDNVVVGLIHAANTVPKTGRGAYWSRAGISEVTSRLGSDVEFYQGLARTPQVAAARG